jgi:hypothetical protein
MDARADVDGWFVCVIALDDQVNCLSAATGGCSLLRQVEHNIWSPSND